MNRFRYAWYTGAAVILISIILLVSGPQKADRLPAGFYTPVVAFEFIETHAEVLDLFGNTPSTERTGLAAAMDRTNRIDFLYMLGYTAFLVIFSAACCRNTGSRWCFLSISIALIVLAADAAENIQLLAITAKIDTPDMSLELLLLHIFTWIKWGGLSAVFLTLIPYMINRGIYGRIITAVSLCTAFSGTAAFLHRSIMNEIFALMSAVIFVMLIVFSFINRNN
ncbi:MAG TPA: hypothetical protein PK514_13820 [Spirochaetota bacterium]|nr:hypothetical protein [Spirochaetota bacterium]